METLIGGNGNDFLTGSELNDVILGNDGDDTLNGLGGNDLLRGGNNNDIMRGASGNDTLIGDRGSDLFNGGFGNDRMIWNDGDGSDIMRGDAGTDVTEFNGSVAQGDDLVLKADGAKSNFQRINLVPITLDVDDTELFEINGLGGDDTLNVKNLTGTDVQQVKFKGGNGNDRLDASQTNVKINADGGNGNDTLIGGNNTDSLDGGEGNDLLRGGGGNDTLSGGNANDTLIGDRGSDLFNGGFGNDRMIWNDGDGSDIMRGGAGTDVTEFNGSVAQGDDLVLKADGAKSNFQRINLVPITLDVDDTELFEINGLGGDDTLNVKNLAATDVQQVNFKGGNGNDRLDASQTNVKINADGGSGNDTLIGGNNTDSLDGGEGNDLLRGGGGNDTLSGGNANDTLIGDRGSDLFNGGFGNDRMIWNDGDGSDIMRGGAGTDVTEFNGSVAQGDDLVLKADGAKSNFQRINLVPITLDVDDTELFEINGLGGDDTLNVKNLAATDVQQVNFKGGNGNDRLDASQTNVKINADGGNGNDTLIGGNNNDTLIGGAGRDFLSGGGGSDTLVGGSLNTATTGFVDTLTGGTGGDRYVLGNGTSVYYNDGNNATAGLNDYALIQGFNTSQDKIQLAGSASKYVLGASPISGRTGTAIYLDTNNNGILGPTDELISVVAGVNLNLTAGYVTYI